MDIDSPEVQQFMEVIQANVIQFSIHEYCCRIIQRMFELCHPNYLVRSSELILNQYFGYLAANEYGVFVLSSMLIHSQDKYKC